MPPRRVPGLPTPQARALARLAQLAGYFFGNIPWVKGNLTAIIIGIIVVSLPRLRFREAKLERRPRLTMPGDESHIADITRMIQLAIAPVFLLSAIATIINVLITQLSRAVDRRRTIEEHLSIYQDQHLEQRSRAAH